MDGETDCALGPQVITIEISLRTNTALIENKLFSVSAMKPCCQLAQNCSKSLQETNEE